VKVDGKRGRRTRLTWEEGIERIGNQRNKTLREMKGMTKDKKDWDRWV
jgi:hypothetical protein